MDLPLRTALVPGGYQRIRSVSRAEDSLGGVQISISKSIDSCYEDGNLAIGM